MSREITELWLRVKVDSSDLAEIRSVFDIPDEIEDIVLAAHLVWDLVEGYFDASRWSDKYIEQIVDGIMHEERKNDA